LSTVNFTHCTLQPKPLFTALLAAAHCNKPPYSLQYNPAVQAIA